MKKIFIPLLFVSVLVACSKLEVTPVVQDNKTVITYQTAPITKGYDVFDKTYIFKSAAYYLPPKDTVDKWKINAKKGTEYIPEGIVKYSDTWKMDTPYYWPKDGGTLTFYSWSLNKTNLDFEDPAPTVVIDKIEGVTVKGYNIAVQKNIDFIVAEPATDKRTNIKTYYAEGVATLFRHQLSQLKVTAKTNADYSASKTFTIQYIKILNVAKIGDYQETQMNNGTWETINKWTTKGKYNLIYTSTPYEVTTKETEISGNQIFYLPQTFNDDEKIEVKYTIVDTKSGIKETVIFQKTLKDITATTSSAGAFKNGTQYTFNLIFGLKEIYWDPAVEDWDNSENPIDV